MKEIPLTQGKVALVDDEDYEWLSKYKWYCQHGYPARNITINGKRSTIRMHQMIMNAPQGMVTDHRDLNPLNNQRSNLRLCTERQNFRNKRKQANARISRYKGVTIHTSRKQFRKGIWEKKYYYAKLTIDRTKPSLTKRFPYTPEGEIAAARQYNEWARKHFGEFAYLNKIPHTEKEHQS